MKRIAALTMVRNDDFFLKKWVEYYGSILGRDNLYIFLDGLDQQIPSFCDGTHTLNVEHIPGNVQEADRGRIDFLSARAKELFESYEMVIGVDVDEFLAVDPSVGKSLGEFLSEVETSCSSISGLGVDVGQNLKLEYAIEADRGLLHQRSFARLSTRYSKASVLLKPVAWGSGFHRTRRGNFHIIKNLYLFHFGCVDLFRIKSKINDPFLAAAGWTNHLEKRAKTIRLVSNMRAMPWDRTVAVARVIQNIIRPPYAWNKPAMFEARLIVRIPERFKDLI